MKILHIIDSLEMGGAENLLIFLAGEQVSRGHNVMVTPLVCSEQTPVRIKIEEKGVQVKPLMQKGSVYSPFCIFKISKILNDYDIVHVHLFPALYWAGIAKIISRSKTPLVYTEHNTNNRRRGNIFFHIIDSFIYQNCYKKIVACSVRAMQTFCDSFPSIKHICAINNGVDIKLNKQAEPYSKRDLLGIDEDCFIVTMVARFMIQKRQDVVVESIAKLPELIHAVFVGGEELDEGLLRVKKLAEDLNISERVHFLYIRHDVPRILKTSDVVVMSSDFEGLSLSSIEGMAAGKPFVASNVDGLREVVNGAGLLFENSDSQALADTILTLFNDKKFYNDVAEQCERRAGEFDINKMVDSYSDVYNSLLD
jgi:glycosyltransferase involved in cell wall biosynthesis